MVGVLTDSTASIPHDLIRALRIEIVPYYIHRGLETLRDMVDVQPRAFAQWLETAASLPTTSNPAPGDYLAGLRNLAARVRAIVALTMTSRGSGAYQSCRAAAEMMCEHDPELKIEVVDTQQVAMVQGWAAIEAARAAAEGRPLAEVARRAREVAQSGMMIQTADTLRYLYLGGRIGRAKHLVASLLNIKPLIGMQEGVIVALGTARSRLKAYRRMAELLEERFGARARVKVAFTHVLAEPQLPLLRGLVTERLECVEVLESELSPALAVHSGPGTVGVSAIPA